MKNLIISFKSFNTRSSIIFKNKIIKFKEFLNRDQNKINKKLSSLLNKKFIK